MKDWNELRKEFLQPAAEYSLLPFWFINGRLDQAEMKRQILDFKAKGVDGFVFHPRLGLTKDTPYLGTRYLDFVRYAVEQAKRHDMRVILYDEAMYPSGSAHGKVVEGNPEFAARAVRNVSVDSSVQTRLAVELAPGETVLLAVAVKIQAGNVLDLLQTVPLVEVVSEKEHSFQLPELTGEWKLVVVIVGFSGGTIRGVHFGEDDGEPAAPKAADLLNPKAVQKFIRVTHEAYYAALKEYFGTTIEAFFTDEPSLLGRCVDTEALRPWTVDFMSWYQAQGNQPLDLLAQWYDVGPLTDLKRRRFRQAVNKRLEQSYYAQLHDWCETHQIALTGHPAGSDDIGCLRYFQIPGQDVVWRWVAPEQELGTTTVHSTMAKCASDSARHLGRRRNGNECFGCCGPVGHPWDFSVDDMKWYFDWLFVRGTNLLYPHAFLYSVEGEERYNERPPDVGPNNAWWPQYHWIAEYAKRLSWLNTDSVNCTSLAVLGEEDHLPWKIVKPLYEHQFEFNYLEDRLLNDMVEVVDGTLRLQHQTYRTLLIEDSTLLDDRLMQRLSSFCMDGGQVLVWMADEQERSRIVAGLSGCQFISSEHQLLDQLEHAGAREIRIRPAGQAIRMSHRRKDGRDFYLLTNEGEQEYQGILNLDGCQMVERWDAWCGTCQQQAAYQVDGHTEIPLRLPRRSSMIYACNPGTAAGQTAVIPARQLLMDVSGPWEVVLPGEKPMAVPLQDWTKDERWRDYYGTVSYQTRLAFPAVGKDKRIWLDLGKVGEIAEVLLDGKSIGTVMWSPYTVELTSYLQGQQCDVMLEVRVTSSFSRKYTDRIRPSGLMGPVRVYVE